MRRRTGQLGLAMACVLAVSACSAQVSGAPEPHPASDDAIAAGRHLLASYGCGACHTIPGVPGAHAVVGPPLDHFYARGYIAGVLPNTQENLIKWIQDPQQVKPGDAMPNLGLSAADAADIAAYLYHQPGWRDWLDQ
jgi:cytochrome c